MGSVITKKDLTTGKSLSLSDQINNLSITTNDQKREVINVLFEANDTIPFSTFISNLFVLLIKKNLNLQDYHKKRIALSFFKCFYSTDLKTSINSMKDIPLELPITKKIFEHMLKNWWNDKNQRSKIFLEPSKLVLRILSIANYVKNNPLGLNNRFIIYGGQPLESSQKEFALNIIFGRKTNNNQPDIAFSEEEPYISRKQCKIGFSNPSDFFLVDYSKTVNTNFIIASGTRCILEPSMVIEINLLHRFFVDIIQPDNIDEEVNIEEGVFTSVSLDEKKENPEKIDESFKKKLKENERKNPHLKLKFINGPLKNQIFNLRPKKPMESFGIGKNVKNLIQITDVNLCAQVLFHEKFGWIIEIPKFEEDEKTENKEKWVKKEIVCTLAKNFEELRDGKESKQIKIMEGMMINIGETIFQADFE